MSLFNSLVSKRDDAAAGTRQQAGNQSAIRPAFKVRQKEDGFAVTIYLPGVAKSGLEITAEANQLRITGRRTWRQPEGWTQIYRESADAPFELTLQHDNSVDADKTEAEFRDGVLRLALPKSEALKARKISIS